jgi:peptide/nickel transport system substrate-binding protein
MGENPVGTGPYKLVKWSRKQEHLLVRNDDYWGAKPAFKYVRIRIIPEKATEIAELLSGGVDIIKAVPPDQMDVINKSGGARTATSPILRTAMLQLDQAARSGPNPFTDKRVRQAANLAVDSDAIIKHVLNGLGDRVATGINPMAFGWDAGLKPYKQDIARAKKLLAEAGFPNGLDIVFNEGPRRGAGDPADQRRHRGRHARRLPVKQSSVTTRCWWRALGRQGRLHVQLVLGYYSVSTPTRSSTTSSVRRDYSYYCNPALDLISQGRSTLDAKKRAEIYVKAQKLLFDEAAYLYKWGLRGVWGISNRVEYEAPADEVDRMFTVTLRKK